MFKILLRVASSVVERHSDKMEVGGSIPPPPTPLLYFIFQRSKENIKMVKKSLIFLITLILVLSAGKIAFSFQENSEGFSRKIVVFKKGVDPRTKEDLIKKAGAIKIKDFKLINGGAFYLSLKGEKLLSQNKEILKIEQDQEVFTLSRWANPKKTEPQPKEILPWGIDRIEAEKVWASTTGDSVKVAVVDTGIDISHPDLRDNIKGGVSTVSYTSSYNDDNGHGTHVAGIIAAIDNEIGVVGVGPKIDLYAVKVLNRKGSGYLSDVIEGLEWVLEKKNTDGGDWVINMSLGTALDNSTFHEVIKKLNEENIPVVAAAGNENGGKVTFPAAYDEVIAVSATDQQDRLASFSSVGPEIDLAAPGVNIYSTYKGKTYTTLSGTSMAAPHVTGVVALLLDTKKCDLDNDNVCSPREIQQRLEGTAKDLGPDGKDKYYGAGLVNAWKALND